MEAANNGEKRFFEIVNWRKAQPKMKGGGQTWMKLYTSLLYHEGFAGLDSTNQMEIVALWLYAAVSGHHILPADPQWLMQRIPLLKKPPDLELLAGLVDCFGKSDPFIKFCPAKVKKDRSKKEERERERESREKRETNPTGSREKEEKEKDGLEKKDTDKHQQTQEEKQTEESEQNPKESEMVPVKVHRMPRQPARSVFNRRGPQHIGDVINDWLPQHWRDPDCEAFGWEIVEALGMPHDADDPAIRSEWGSFASTWSKIKARASPFILDEVRVKAIEKARFVNSPKAKSARNKSAVWYKIMLGELSELGLAGVV